MPTYYQSLPDHLQTWALAQPLFFTASAPSKGKHINISPKGLPTSCLSIPNQNTLLYLDATGSGCETISHIYDNGRITVMFISFDTSPRILRLFCTGRVIESETAEYDFLLPTMGCGDNSGGVGIPTARAIIHCDIFKVQTSCGYGVPLFLEGRWEDRNTLAHWGKKTVAAGKLGEYQVKNNVRSLDGLLGLRLARRNKGEWMGIAEVWATVARVWGYLAVFLMGLFVGILFMATDTVSRKAVWNLGGKGFMADW